MSRAHDFPDGIDARNLRSFSPVSWLSVALLALLLATALTGLAGGRPSPVRTVAARDVTLTVATPGVLRNGVFFETRIAVRSNRDVGKLVLAVSPPLWRDLTINSQIPAATEESVGKGGFRFDYGPLRAGRAIEIKIDGQVNPPLTGGTRGTIAVFDDDRPLAVLPLAFRVLP